MDPVPPGTPRIRLGDLYPASPSDAPTMQPTSDRVSPEMGTSESGAVNRENRRSRSSRRWGGSEGMAGHGDDGDGDGDGDDDGDERPRRRTRAAARKEEPLGTGRGAVGLSSFNMVLESSFSALRRGDMPPESLATRTVAVADGLGKNLRVLGWAFIWMVAVRIVMAVCFYTGAISADYAVSQDSRINNALIGTATSADGMLNLTASYLAFLVAYQCDVIPEAARRMGEAFEQVLLIISAILNTFTISLIMRSAIDLVIAVIVHNDMLAVIGGTMLLFALFWLSGVMLLHLWYSRTELQMNHFSGVAIENEDGLGATALLAPFLMNMIYGRPYLEKQDEVSGRRPALQKPTASVISMEDTAIAPLQMQIPCILIDAMVKSQTWICIKVYTGILLMWAYGDRQLWPQLAAEVIDMAKYLTVFGVIHHGTGSFQGLIISPGSRVENLLRALQALSSMFAMFWFAFIAAATLTLGVAVGFSTRS